VELKQHKLRYDKNGDMTVELVFYVDVKQTGLVLYGMQPTIIPDTIMSNKNADICWVYHHK
jgi:hypothetical protein